MGHLKTWIKSQENWAHFVSNFSSNAFQILLFFPRQRIVGRQLDIFAFANSLLFFRQDQGRIFAVCLHESRRFDRAAVVVRCAVADARVAGIGARVGNSPPFRRDSGQRWKSWLLEWPKYWSSQVLEHDGRFKANEWHNALFLVHYVLNVSKILAYH